MELHVTGPTEITINKNIKSIGDYQLIRKEVLALVENGANAVTLKIPDSLSMTSAVIGFFIKLIRHEQKKVTMYIGDRRLHELLDELNLTEIFNVRRIN
jgi:hypothetical protein